MPEDVIAVGPDLSVATQVVEASDEADELKALDEEAEALEAEAESIEKETTKTFARERRELRLHAARVKVADAKLCAQAESELGRRGVDWDIVPHRDGGIIVKRPSDAHFRRWQDDGLKTTSTALENLSKHAIWEKCLSWKDYCARVKAEPMTILRTASVLNRLAGARAEEFESK